MSRGRGVGRDGGAEDSLARRVLEAAPVVVLVLDGAGRIRHVNPYFERLSGYRLDEVRGKDWFDTFLPERDRADKREVFARTLAGEHVRGHGSPIVTRAGAERLIEWTSESLDGDGADGPRILAIGQDVTERRAAEERLRAGEATLREAQHLAKCGSWELDLVGGALTWSDEIFRIFEIDPARFGASYEAFLALVHPEDRDAVDRAYRESVANHTPYEIVHRLRMPDGRLKWVHERCLTHYAGNGRPLRSLGTVQDISERKRLELRLRDILDSMLAFVGLYDLDGKLIEANRAPLELAGLRREDVIGKPFWEAYWWSYSPETMAQVRDTLARAARGEVVRDDFVARMAGERFITIDAVFGPLRDGSGRIEAVVGSAVDVTERKQAAESARRSAELLRAVVHGAPVIMFALDRRGVFKLSEGRALASLGLRGGELVGVPSLERYRDVVGYPETFRRALAGEQASFTSTVGDFAFEAVMAPSYDAQGQVDGVIGVAIDISERVAAEATRKRAEAQVRASLAEKETLLREIHHRVKNNLQIISSLLNFQMRRLRAPEDASALAELRQRLFAMTLVHERLYLSHDVGRVDLGSYVRGLVTELRRAFPPRAARIEVDADGVALPIEVALPCGMIICELVTNVLKYAFPGEQGGNATVSVRRADDRVVIGVDDDGVGFPAGFDPAAGHGFGWELVRGLAAQLDASVTATSDRGVSVRVAFAAPAPAG
jgi:PAS domain S-box-containing protein